MDIGFFADVALIILFMSIIIMPVKNLGESPPYFYKKMLLNEKEQVIFIRLVEAMPNHHVMVKVRLADIVGVKECEKWQVWFNKISRKSVDFTICNISFAVQACIEIDWKTHDQEQRQKADISKNEVLKIAGIPIVQIEANKIPSTEEIKAMLEKTLLHTR